MTNALPFNFGSAYRAIRLIGNGASGCVYAGEHRERGERVAIKILHSHLHNDSDVVRRFITERTTLTALASPRIIAVKDLVVDAGMLGIVMELAEGPSLGTFLEDRGAIRPNLALELTRQIAEALEYAHTRGVVHRDVKPDNIILTDSTNLENPGAKVADFGIAKIVGTKSSSTGLLGTAHFMAPELISDNVVSPSVDMYALGVTFYQMLTGHLPFGSEDDNSFTIARHHIESAVPRPTNLDDELWTLLSSLLAKKPERRLDASALIERINQLTEHARSLPALENQKDRPVPHPATILREAPLDFTREENTASESDHTDAAAKTHHKQIDVSSLKSVGHSPAATILKPAELVPKPPADTEDEDGEPITETQWWRHPKTRIAGIVAAILVLALTIVGLSKLTSSKSDTDRSSTGAAFEVSLAPIIYPSGLTAVRTGEVADGKLIYSITYTSIKAPLSGNVFEAFQTNTECPQPEWSTQLKVSAHSPATTSIDADCGWSIELPAIDGNHTATASATIATGTEFTDEQQLRDWLEDQQNATEAALSDPETTSTAYPLQRLLDMRIEAPTRVKQGTSVPIAVIGIWPGGENSVTPIYVTPSSPNPTSILSDITGGDLSRLRLTDRCSGAVSITPDGHDLSALHPASCTIGANIGNYELAQVPITITSSGS